MSTDASALMYADFMGCAPLPADLESIFSSPATDVADPAVVANNSFMLASTDPLPTSTDPLSTSTDPLPTSTHPLPTGTDPLPTCTDPLPTCTDPLPTPTALLPPAIPFQSRQPENATMESLIGNTVLYHHSILPTPLARDAQILPINMPPQPPAPPHLQRAIATELALPASLFSSPPPPPSLSVPPTSPPGSSEAPAQPTEHRSRSLKRKRSLETLRAAAVHNAPDVNMTDEELLAIGDMHETEEEVQQSKEVYFALQQLKQVLAACNYRIKSLQIEESEVHDVPIEFIVSKRRRAASDASSESKKRPTSSCADANPRATKRSRSSTSSVVERPFRLSCLVCQKSVADLDTLVRHFRHAHQELKPYACTRCGGLYASENTLWSHVNNVHPATPRMFKCDYCDASFDQTGAKTRHEHAAHSNAESFVCSFEGCSLRFKFPAHLENHAQRAHSNFRPFACSAKSCSKRFANLNGLNRHAREVHEKKSVYHCHCGKSIPKRDHLKRHLLNVHKMDMDSVKEEMKKHPHPGVMNLVATGPGPPPTVDGSTTSNAKANASSRTHQGQK